MSEKNNVQRTQVNKSEQINSRCEMVIDYDQPLTKQEDFLAAFKKALGPNVSIIKFQNNKPVYLYKSGNMKHYILAAAVTYLSKPHPIFKKRIQLKKWYKDFYNEYKKERNTTISIMGIYHYDGTEIYCDFNKADYLGKKMHSSSAHIYTNDLFQSMQNGIFHKVDMNSNHINVIHGKYLKQYMDNSQSVGVPDSDIVRIIKKFNNQFNFNEWLMADECIKQMVESNWYQAKGTEWAGWYLEYKFNEFITKENCVTIMVYTGNNQKKEDQLDFDLFFPTSKFYGDLKASDINEKFAPANDQKNMLEALNEYEKLCYIIYEHDTVKDKERENEMAIARMEIIDPLYKYKVGDEITYQGKMKHSVKFKKMSIYELNKINMHEMLIEFNQGHNSGPQMAERAKKFLLRKENRNNSVIFSYEA